MEAHQATKLNFTGNGLLFLDRGSPLFRKRDLSRPCQISVGDPFQIDQSSRRRAHMRAEGIELHVTEEQTLLSAQQQKKYGFYKPMIALLVSALALGATGLALKRASAVAADSSMQSIAQSDYARGYGYIKTQEKRGKGSMGNDGDDGSDGVITLKPGMAAWGDHTFVDAEICLEDTFVFPGILGFDNLDIMASKSKYESCDFSGAFRMWTGIAATVFEGIFVNPRTVSSGPSGISCNRASYAGFQAPASPVNSAIPPNSIHCYFTEAGTYYFGNSAGTRCTGEGSKVAVKVKDCRKGRGAASVKYLESNTWGFNFYSNLVLDVGTTLRFVSQAPHNVVFLRASADSNALSLEQFSDADFVNPWYTCRDFSNSTRWQRNFMTDVVDDEYGSNLFSYTFEEKGFYMIACSFRVGGPGSQLPSHCALGQKFWVEVV
eukprot:g81153.t1